VCSAEWLFGQEATAKTKPSMGINLAGPADWNTELPFVDVFHLSRPWISQRDGAAWGTGPELALDDHGWVKRLEPHCFAETPLCTIEGGHYPSGRWTVLWKGTGKIEMSHGRVVESQKGRMVVEINSERGTMFLRLKETSPEDPVRAIQVLMPGVTPQQAAENPWNPEFLHRWTGMACVRFMDFQETNNSKLQHWNDRPLLDDATYAEQGIPVELLCDLANRLQCDAWFCMPHGADDEFVAQFAGIVSQQLKAPHRAYVEYSNEVWNSQFAQHRYAAERGQQAGLADKPWEAAWRYYAQRSVEIFDIWQKHFEAERLVRVLASQAANAYVSEQILQHENAGKHADALAIAPYVSFNVPLQGEDRTAEEVASWSVDRLLDEMERSALPESIRWMREQKKWADRYKLTLVCYEAGQHMVGIGGAENNEALTQLFRAANAHPRMSNIYDDYYLSWEEVGGDLLCHFSSVSQWSKWGSWGLLEYADSPPESSPKFQATTRWVQRWQQAK
jgi:hypothetical protein